MPPIIAGDENDKTIGFRAESLLSRDTWEGEKALHASNRISTERIPFFGRGAISSFCLINTLRLRNSRCFVTIDYVSTVCLGLFKNF